MSDDPKLSQRYRELPREEPPRSLDDAILAASRRAVESRPAPLVVPTGRRRWYFPVAAAAVIVLAVAVVAHVDREQPDAEVLTAPAPAAAPEAPAPPPSSIEKRRNEAPKAAAKPARPQFAPDPRADSSPPASVAAPAEAQKRIAENREMAAASAGARDEQPRAQSQMARASAVPNPEAELERIARLRAAGRHEEADRALAEFRKRYPDYRFSDEMKAKVEKRQ